MRRILHFLLLLVVTNLSFTPLSNPAYAITVKTIGPTGNFATITAALSNLQVTPATDALIWELQAGYTSAGETFPITFSTANLNGINSINTLTIRPAANATGLTISNSTATITVLLSGASYVNFDGRPGGIGTAKELTISNTFATAQAAVQLQNTSHHNTFRYVSMKGQNLYVLTFYGIGVTGLNTYNTIDYCDVSNSGTGNLNAAIFSYSNTPTAQSFNQYNSITNCNIYNFFHATNSAYGIYLAAGNSDWTITGNHIYQTAPRTMPYDAYGIIVSGTNGTNFNISNNYIGGSAPNAGGTTPWTVSSGAGRFYGIYVLSNTTPAAFNSTVSNNTISNLDITNTNYYGFYGIYLSSSATSGLLTISGNTIGSSSSADAIILRGANTSCSGIEKIGTGQSVNCTNNTVGGITMPLLKFIFYGIYMSGGTTSLQNATHTINGNTVGSASVANNIRVGSAAVAVSAVGIYNASYKPYSISNNTISNISNLYEGAGVTGNLNPYVKGLTFGGNGLATVNGNSIFNLICKSSQIGTGGSASVIGIHSPSASTINQNVIYGLKNTSLTGAVNVAGIAVTGSATTISRNSISGLSLSTSATAASITGIYAGSSANVQNNEIRLGKDASGTDISTGYAISGINDISSCTYYFNSVHVSGSNVTGITSPTYAFISTGVPTLKDNVFVNTRSGGTTGLHYALKLAIAPTTIDYNDYFVAGGTGFLAALGATNYTDFATWKSTAVPAKDLASLNVDPAFTSATNLVPTNSALAAGTPIAGITVDNAGTTRAAIPTMGAFEAIPCPNPTSGGIISANQAGCNPFDPALIENIGLPSGHTGTLEYKWQQSTVSDLTGFSDIAGTNAISYNPGQLTQTTWFKRLARVTCKNNWTGAAESNVVTMTVNPLLPASVSVAALPEGPVCAGTSVLFTATPTNGGTNPTYQWKLGGVDITGETASTYSYVPANGDIISVMMTSDPNDPALVCVSGSPATSTDVVMTVNPLLPASVSVAALPAGPVCAGTSVLFTATPTNGGTNPTYQWKLGGVDIPSANAVTYSYVPANGDAISVVMTADPNDPALVCVSGSPATSTDVVMTVNPLLPASVSVAANTNPSCDGAPVIFTAIPINGGNAPTIEWFKNTVLVGTGLTYSYAPVNGDQVYAVMTADPTLSCVTGSPATSNSVTMTVNPLPTAVITNNTGTNILSCTVTSISLTASGGDTYQWNKGLGTNASVLITSAGNYQVTVTNAFGCSSAATIIITQAPAISSVTASAGIITTIGGTTTLTVNATGGVQPYTYSLNGGTYQASNTFIIGAGTYSVNVMDANGCTMNSNSVTVSDPVFLPSFLTYTGVLSVQTNSQANLSATLLNSNNKGISGRTILFTIGSQSTTATTNGQGRATVSLVINQTPGTYQMITSFAGDATYASSSDSDPFTITGAPIPVTASLIGTVTKVYDGNKTAFMLSANYQLNGVTAGDNVSLNNPPTGTYNNKNVGTNKTVTVIGLALTGPDAGKYILSSTTASANIGTITALKSAEIATDVTTQIQPIDSLMLKTYPNPFTERLYIEFSNATNTHARIEILDITGSKLETLFDNQIDGGQLYKVEYIPNMVSSHVIIYRLITNTETRQGKVIYNENR